MFYTKMINKTEEVCVLENISINLWQIEQQLLLQDPYDSVWLKIMAILFYFIGIFTAVIMLAFINYEKEHHGNFRSVINQLLSNLYAMVSSLVYPIRHYRNMYHTCANCQYLSAELCDNFFIQKHFSLFF